MSIKRVKLLGLFSLLVFAIGNASIRLSSGGMTSFFRIIAPVIVVLILLQNLNKLSKSLIVILIGIIYSVIASVVGYGTIMYEYIVFVFYIYAIYIIVFDVRKNVINFEEFFWKFLHSITTVTLILAVIQYFIRIPYPYVALPSRNGVNLFMSNENELALPLGMISLIYFHKILFEKRRIYIPWLIAIFGLIFINDAKLTLLGCVLGYMVLVFFYIRKKIKMSPRVFVILSILFITFGVFVLYVLNPNIVFRDYSINMKDLIFSSIEKIFKLEPLEGGGSMVDRTNAIIFGIKELIKSNLLGIGWGNSVTMLSMSEYDLVSANSMHNIVFQFLCEMGIYAFIVYIFFIKVLVKNIGNVRRDDNCVLKATAIIAFVIISAQSSIGILSNYYMWIILFYIAFLPTTKAFLR